MRRQLRRSHGFTLVEMLFVIVIMSIVCLIIGRLLLNTYLTFSTAQNIADADWNNFLAIERIVNDVHRIRSPGDISTITASQFAMTDVSGNAVSYQFSGSTLTRNSQTLATNIQSFSFAYYDKNGTVTATASSVRYIKIAISVLKGTIPSSFSTLAATRGMTT